MNPNVHYHHYFGFKVKRRTSLRYGRLHVGYFLDQIPNAVEKKSLLTITMPDLKMPEPNHIWCQIISYLGLCSLFSWKQCTQVLSSC